MNALICTAPCLSLLLLSAGAHAKQDDDDNDTGRKVAVGLDGNLSAAVNVGSKPLGSGLALRLGVQSSSLGLLAFRPEIGGSYTRLLAHDVGRVYGGARFGVQFLVGVYAYGHAGYGWGAPSDQFTFDFGAAVDLLLLDVFRPGVHAEYVNILENLEAVNAGIHVDFVF